MSRRPFRVGRSKTGLGLFATEPIKKGQFLAYYRGPKITAAESEKREARGNRYLYEINSRWVIDGSPRYNIARYGNHSCRPNAETDVRGHKVLIRTIKNIKPGEEITYHYGKNYFDIYLRPIGCKCDKCIEKRRKERSAKIAETKRRKALEARKAAKLAANGVAASGDAAKAVQSSSIVASVLSDKKTALSKSSQAKKVKKTRAKATTTKTASKSKAAKAKASKAKVSKAKALKTTSKTKAGAAKAKTRTKSGSTRTAASKSKSRATKR